MAIGKTWSISVPITKEGGTWGDVTVYFQEEYYPLENYSTIKVTEMTGRNSIRLGWFHTAGSITVNGTGFYSWGTYDWEFPCVDYTSKPFEAINASGYPSGFVVYHDADGSKNITVSVTISEYWGSNPTWGGNGGTVTNTIALTSIPRASGLSVSDGTLGVAQILTVDRKSESYTHTITYNCEGTWGTICEKSASQSISFTLPVSLASKNTTGTSVSVVFWIVTYSGDTQIGDAKKTTVSFAIPSSVGLRVSDGWATVSPYNTGTAAAELSVYVQGYSRAEVSFDETKISAANAYGAEIASYQITCNGKQYISPYRSDTLNAAGAVTVTATVIDSRGYAINEDFTIYVEAYTKPILSGVRIFRCDNAGVASDEGLYLSVTATSNISSLAEQNASTMQLEIGSLMTVAIPNGETVVVGDALVLSTATYQVKLTVTDALGNTAVYTQTIPTADVFFHGRQGGKGAAFGKYAEADDLLDVDWNLRVQKNLDIDGTVHIGGGSIELNQGGTLAGYGGFIDFHYDGSDADYTSRIIEDKEGSLDLRSSNGLRINGKALLDLTYPVGAIYISTVSTSPASLFGGTWTQITNRFLLASGSSYSAGSSGGAATVTLTTNHLPKMGELWAPTSHGFTSSLGVSGAVDRGEYWGFNTVQLGNSGAHNNMPPYIAVYMWKRTA